MVINVSTAFAIPYFTENKIAPNYHNWFRSPLTPPRGTTALFSSHFYQATFSVEWHILHIRGTLS